MVLDRDIEIKQAAPDLAREIQQAAAVSHNEAELRSKIARHIEDIADRLKVPLYVKEECTLLDGRADAVYNRLIIEYEPPNSLRPNNSFRPNLHAIEQVNRYKSGLVRRERHKPERLAGVVLDGSYFIFIRWKNQAELVDQPVKVEAASTEHFLKLLASLSTELALVPENLVRDFGENRPVARKAVSALYAALTKTQIPKVQKLFEQWSLQFGEVSDYEKGSKLNVDSFARRFGITTKNAQPFHFFIHTYYALFIKLLAVQVVHYYLMPKVGTDLKQAATFSSPELKSYLEKMERGGIFSELGIKNLMEGDFFRWYLDIWDDSIYEATRDIVATLSNYSLVTLEVDPESTRDLLKKLYQELMPGKLRHNLGEYYTPDWLAERLLNMLGGGKFEGNPNKRLLDPACGSGTFLVLVIKKIREYASNNMLPEHEVLDKILSNVVGFDLNPLAVISARTNYLLALGDLLQHRKGDITIPVYLCDSVVTPQEGKDLFAQRTLRFHTAVGPFSLPKSVIEANLIDKLSNLLEQAVELDLNREQFVDSLCQRLPLIPGKDDQDIEVVAKLYDNLLLLERQGINGIWARIIKNAFAPLFAGEFDYVAGNPPWVNWESLPENYRQQVIPLYEDVYGLFPHKGFRKRHGSTKIDISTLMAYVSLDRYVKQKGKLGFLITQSVFKTDAGKGFRTFALPNNSYLEVHQVDDMVELKPFEGVGNRTAVVVLQKGKKTKYPVPYNYWRKRAKGKAIKDDLPLAEVTKVATYKQFYAEPVSESDITSAWLTGRPKAIKAVKKVLGQSDYVAHEGVNTGGANGVYWVETVETRPDGLVVVSNITEGSKTKVEGLEMAIEPDLLYPLVRGRDVKRWQATPSASIIVPQDPADPSHGLAEDTLKIKFPSTYKYLNRFRQTLESRSAHMKYLKHEPFYALYDIKAYTFAPYKVVWPWISTGVRATVLTGSEGKSVCPEHNTSFMGLWSREETHYLCALLNSAIGDFAIRAYYSGGGGGIASPAVLQNIHIPKFDSHNKIHRDLAQLSQDAHYAVGVGDSERLQEIEQEIDKLAARIWGLTDEELRDIKTSLEEMS